VSANRLAVVVLSCFTALLLQVTVLARLSFLAAIIGLLLIVIQVAVLGRVWGAI